MANNFQRIPLAATKTDLDCFGRWPGLRSKVDCLDNSNRSAPMENAPRSSLRNDWVFPRKKTMTNSRYLC